MAERLETEVLDTATLPVLPLTSGVVLPQMVVTLALETDEAKAAADAAAEAGGELLLVPRFPDGGRYGRVEVRIHHGQIDVCSQIGGRRRRPG